jgi:hypothetical protein
MSIFVDNHYNRYSLLELRAIREAGRSYHHVSWLAVELLALKRVFVSQLAGWLAVELLALKRGICVAVSWLAVELLALKRGVCVAVSWLAFLLSG